MKHDRAKFDSEAAMCAAFIAALPEGWTAYPETDFDILLCRNSDGAQIGIEAKLRLNAEVISQICDDGYDPCRSGPDYRAVLVPAGTAGSLSGICRKLGITVIEMSDDTITNHYDSRRAKFSPALPKAGEQHWYHYDHWMEWAPLQRLQLPDYVPDVVAGRSGPVKLTEWKIRAIKIAVLLERRGHVTRQDFKAIGIDYRRWIEPYTGWLARGAIPGQWIAGQHIGTFKAQHPVNYEQIAADFDKWAPKQEAAIPPQGVLV